MNKFISFLCVSAFSIGFMLPAFADFKEHFDLGQQYLANYQ